MPLAAAQRIAKSLDGTVGLKLETLIYLLRLDALNYRDGNYPSKLRYISQDTIIDSSSALLLAITLL